MKTNRLIALLAAAVLALAFITPITGCKTTTTGTNTVDPLLITKLAPILRTSVAGAVVYGYTKNTNAIKYIAVVQTALQQFILSTNLSPAALMAVIYDLPVKELKTPEAQLIITPLLSAYAAFGQQYVQSGLDQQVGWKMLVQAITDGITDGLQGVAQIRQGVSMGVVSSPGQQ